MSVLIYQGQGVSPNCSRLMEESLREVLSDGHTFTQIKTAESLKKELLSEDVTGKCLVIPGGDALGLITGLCDLASEVNSFTQRGGRFIGSCAGAMLACKKLSMRKLSWNAEKTKVIEVIDESRPTFTLDALGLIPELLMESPGNHDDAQDKNRYGRISWVGRSAPTVHCFNEEKEEPVEAPVVWAGGGYFTLESTPSEGLKVLDLYKGGRSDRRTATVLFKKGKGFALLTSIHPEFTTKFINPKPGQRITRIQDFIWIKAIEEAAAKQPLSSVTRESLRGLPEYLEKENLSPPRREDFQRLISEVAAESIAKAIAPHRTSHLKIIRNWCVQMGMDVRKTDPKQTLNT